MLWECVWGFEFAVRCFLGLCAFWFETSMDKVSGLGGPQTAKTQPFAFCFLLRDHEKPQPRTGGSFCRPCEASNDLVFIGANTCGPVDWLNLFLICRWSLVFGLWSFVFGLWSLLSHAPCMACVSPVMGPISPHYFYFICYLVTPCSLHGVYFASHGLHFTPLLLCHIYIYIYIYIYIALSPYAPCTMFAIFGHQFCSI